MLDNHLTVIQKKENQKNVPNLCYISPTLYHNANGILTKNHLLQGRNGIQKY